ncbi:4-(cytidine 5'-diphospho)-2-C-methyl-D-erythritol kinase [Stappia stellulata]|uniref:4-(cytidine 5'-diphospho)-2-C-methyl-D-erythritol kinase n=1 Tax=Stappia stellulata TaxID=71235 RepID=UPI00040B52D2|nr:4-(cytidine 5'-diphospho)-2-C-methyl-D-erythritol kinase [Stappia stellulata]
MTEPPRPTAHARLARAKLNYALHVTGQRADGYHLVESLAVFPAIGDRVSLAPAGAAPGLSLSGRFSGDLGPSGSGEDNLVVKAAACLAQHLGRDADAALALKKALPVASGIGGGSADAAAALRLLRDLWAPELDDTILAELAAKLGADVPMCLFSKPARIGGIGELVTPLAPFPAHAVVLANPGIAVSTPEVFKALKTKANAPLPDLPHDGFGDLAALCAWLASTRNDLEEPARALAPDVDAVLAALGACAGARLARMSGSGATCFAIFETLQDAQAAEHALHADRPGWWIAAAPVERIGTLAG